MNKDIFIKECEIIGVDIDDDIFSKLDIYYNFLIESNNKFNLTTITKEEDVYLKHFYDSICAYLSGNIKDGIGLCDFGSGAGFPGMVLAIVFPNINVTLVESNNKKCGFLHDLKCKLGLTNVNVVCDRVENFAKSNRNKFDVVICRAVSSISIITELGSALVKLNGNMVFLKSSYEEELELSMDIIEKTGFTLNKTIEFVLPDFISKRSIITLIKINETPLMYPRSYSTIVKMNRKKLK